MVVRGGRVGAAGGAAYRLTVRGEIDQRFEYLFEPMALTRTAGTTVISGKVVDQAQLHGLIERIADLGLELLSVERVSEPT